MPKISKSSSVYWFVKRCLLLPNPIIRGCCEVHFDNCFIFSLESKPGSCMEGAYTNWLFLVGFLLYQKVKLHTRSPFFTYKIRKSYSGYNSNEKTARGQKKTFERLLHSAVTSVLPFTQCQL